MLTLPVKTLKPVNQDLSPSPGRTTHDKTSPQDVLLDEKEVTLLSGQEPMLIRPEEGKTDEIPTEKSAPRTKKPSKNSKKVEPQEPRFHNFTISCPKDVYREIIINQSRLEDLTTSPLCESPIGNNEGMVSQDIHVKLGATKTQIEKACMRNKKILVTGVRKEKGRPSKLSLNEKKMKLKKADEYEKLIFKANSLLETSNHATLTAINNLESNVVVILKDLSIQIQDLGKRMFDIEKVFEDPVGYKKVKKDNEGSKSKKKNSELRSETDKDLVIDVLMWIDTVEDKEEFVRLSKFLNFQAFINAYLQGDEIKRTDAEESRFFQLGEVYWCSNILSKVDFDKHCESIANEIKKNINQELKSSAKKSFTKNFTTYGLKSYIMLIETGLKIKDLNNNEQDDTERKFIQLVSPYIVDYYRYIKGKNI